MRLKRHLTQSPGIEKIVDAIQKDCKPFLSEFRNAKNFLNRTDLKFGPHDFYQRSVRKDRRPYDMPRLIHDLLSSLFKDRFGWNPREEGLFCWLEKIKEINFSIDRRQTTLGAVFPIGEYQYLYNTKIRDLYSYIDEWLVKQRPKEIPIDVPREQHVRKYSIQAFRKAERFGYPAQLYDDLKHHLETEVIPSYKNRSAATEILGHAEISLNTGNVYMVSFEKLPEVIEELNLNWNFG